MKRTVFEFIGSLGDGGAETLVKDYALLLDKNEFDVIILTTFPLFLATANSKALNNAGISILPIIPWRQTFLVRALFKLFKRIWVPLMLLYIVRRYRPEVIHVHMANLYAMALISTFLKGIKIIYTCHSIPDKFLGKSERPVEYKAARRMFKQGRLQMIALHEEMRQEINGMFEVNNTLVINNGIDFEKYRPLNAADERRLRMETGLSTSDFVLGHVGRFSKVKNHKFILEVFAEVCKIRQNAKLLLIGSGSLESEILLLADTMQLKERLIILSHRSDVNQLLRLMNVFIFPSFYEGLSIALIEAQVSGLKCLVSDSVNPVAILATNAIPLSLQLSAKDWCDAIFNEGLVNPNPGDITKYNLRQEIKKLEKLYNHESINSI